jgi:hypothetical protein
MVLDGSIVTLEPAARLPPAVKALNAPNVMPGVPVASSVYVPPLVSNTRSPASADVGMVTVYDPLALRPDLATSTPADFTITTAPFTGPANTVPETEVVEVVELPLLLPESLPPQPKITSKRQSVVMSLRTRDVYDFIWFSFKFASFLSLFQLKINGYFVSRMKKWT